MDYMERILALREDRDLNQTKIAEYLNIAQTTYSDYEHGKVRIPIECLIKLGRFYDVDLNYITGVSNIKNPFPKR
jgi:Predicted transcriptional regulators